MIENVTNSQSPRWHLEKACFCPTHSIKLKMASWLNNWLVTSALQELCHHFHTTEVTGNKGEEEEIPSRFKPGTLHLHGKQFKQQLHQSFIIIITKDFFPFYSCFKKWLIVNQSYQCSLYIVMMTLLTVWVDFSFHLHVASVIWRFSDFRCGLPPDV